MSLRIADFKLLVPKEFAALVKDHAVGVVFAEKAGIDRDRRRVPFIASDDSVDLDDEIIAAGAFHQDIKTYSDNPALLACHRYATWTGASPVIGSVHEMQTEHNPFHAIAEFAQPPADKDHWLLYRDGHQRAFSVGFAVKDTEKRDGRRVITRGLLLEISAVPVPANSNALVINHLVNQVGRAAGESADDGAAHEFTAAIVELRRDLDTLLGRAPTGDKDQTPSDDENALSDDEREFAEMLAAGAGESSGG